MKRPYLTQYEREGIRFKTSIGAFAEFRLRFHQCLKTAFIHYYKSVKV